MKLVASILAASLSIVAGAANVYAQTETTETTTTTTQTTTPSTILTSSGFVLPGGITYTVINPTTGVVGVYDPGTRLINGHPLSTGWFITEQSTGKVVATVDASGSLVAMTTFPTILPQHFVLVGNQLLYFADDYAYRRAQLEAKMNGEYAVGHLTNHQMDELREDMGRIASLCAKRKSDGTYSRSTVREMERRFADASADMSKYLASTNQKRAKIGIVPQ